VTRQEREAFTRVVELVRQKLTQAGSRDAADTMARVTATLRGAAADPARHDDLRHSTFEGSASGAGLRGLHRWPADRRGCGAFREPIKRVQRDESAAERRERERAERAREALRVAESEVADWQRRAKELDDLYRPKAMVFSASFSRRRTASRLSTYDQFPTGLQARKARESR
jgi:hypothetical protein